jgi:HK97 family phage portal protein
VKFTDRVKAFFGSSEGLPRGAFSGMGELGGIYGIEPLGDGWQRNLTVDGMQARNVPAVYACTMAIARSVSQCYPKHIRETNGVNESIKTSAAYRVLRKPNSFQSTPEFLLNLIATTLFDGECFALAGRNDRNEITSLHIMPRGSVHPMVEEDTKTIYYSIGSSPLISTGVDFVAPQRDVLHLKFYTDPSNPLRGISPIKSAAMAIGINVALSKSQVAFFNNMNRPSGILSTDQVLTKEQMVRLREAFDEQSKRLANGGIPILSGGMKFLQMSIDSVDAQLIESQRMSVETICSVFGVPPPLIGDLSHATLNNSEILIQHFLSMSLGSHLETIERAFDNLFGLPNNEYIELDTSALLRTNMESRINSLVKGVQGGLFTPSEARAREGLSPIKGGDSAYLQRQMVAIDKIGELLDAEIAAKNNPPAPTADQTDTESDTEEPEDLGATATNEGKDIDVELAKALLENYMRKTYTK